MDNDSVLFYYIYLVLLFQILKCEYFYYLDDVETSISTSPMSPGRIKTPEMPPPGLDTLEEQEDKEIGN